VDENDHFPGMLEFEANDVRYISSPELGEILGISDIEVCRLARAGMLPRVPREKGRAFLYPLVACLKAYLKYRNSQSVKDREAYLREKARTERARAQKLELENALREGQQVNIQEVAREMREQHSAVRQRLLILPHRAARRIPGDPVLTERILAEEVTDCLSALAALGKEPHNGQRKAKSHSKEAR
jgi:phage terminase Nu1 subunit (DNA packaging protein)